MNFARNGNLWVVRRRLWCHSFAVGKWKARARQLIVNQFHFVRMAPQRMGMAKDLPYYPDREASGYPACRHLLFGSHEMYPHPSHKFEQQRENNIGCRTETAQHHHCCFRFKFHTRCLTQKGTCHAKAAKNRCFNTDSSRSLGWVIERSEEF